MDRGQFEKLMTIPELVNNLHFLFVPNYSYYPLALSIPQTGLDSTVYIIFQRAEGTVNYDFLDQNHGDWKQSKSFQPIAAGGILSLPPPTPQITSCRLRFRLL